MAKAKNRKELLNLTKELGLHAVLDHHGLSKLLDVAQEQPDPEAYLQGLAREKREAATRPRREAPAPAAPPTSAPAAPQDSRPHSPEPGPSQEAGRKGVAVELPDLAEILPGGHHTRFVEVRLTGYPLAREALTRLRLHLDATHARCRKGKHIESPARALVWLLEQYAAACGLTEDDAPTSLTRTSPAISSQVPHAAEDTPPIANP